VFDEEFILFRFNIILNTTGFPLLKLSYYVLQDIPSGLVPNSNLTQIFSFEYRKH